MVSLTASPWPIGVSAMLVRALVEDYCVCMCACDICAYEKDCGVLHV